MVPHLITATNAPIDELEQRILDSMPAIERWFRLEWMEHTPLFYSSVDVRHAGFKLAPVDINLCPHGWNNLTPDMLPLTVQAAMAAIEKICPEARNLLIIPENEPRDTFYWANVQQLKRVFHQAGLNVRFGSLNATTEQPVTVKLPGGQSLTLEPLVRTDRRLGLKDFDPCTILLNNDLSEGIPGILEDLNEQYLVPPLHASSSVRRKSNHYNAYEEVTKRFAKLLGIDYWLINPMFTACGEVDFGNEPGVEQLRTQIDALLVKVKRKYKEYGINEKPFIVIKAEGGEDGAHGLGIMTVRDGKDLDALVKTIRDKARQDTANAGAGTRKMAKKAALLAPPEIIIQEGVLTNERVNAAVAEPVVYMMDRFVVGGFYRVHAGRGPDESLCSPGASYVPLAFSDSGRLPQTGEKPGSSSPNRFYMYGVIARLAMLAASYELEATDPDAEVYD
ncbi:MAG: glutamate--cysteine ligase [Polaromonas sp.]|nr:glutamate--cysteine ligase [Polaromonas sp.]